MDLLEMPPKMNGRNDKKDVLQRKGGSEKEIEEYHA